jgi:hypothetical protein
MRTVTDRPARSRRSQAVPLRPANSSVSHNTVERAFGKLRQNRAVATRFDKRGFIWRGTVDVASITICLRDPVP